MVSPGNNRELKRRTEIDGLCKLESASRGVKRFGSIDEYSRLKERSRQDARWNLVQQAAGTGVGQVKRVEIVGRMARVMRDAAKPRYEVGDTFVYSDGSWEQVVDSNQERVQWRNHYGNNSVGSPDFTYKRSRWQTSTRIGTRTFQQTSYVWDTSTDTLWPLALKNKTRYDEEGRWVGKDGIERK